MASITVSTHSGEIKVSPRWNGQNLAVHSTIVNRDDGLFGLATKVDNVYWKWTITHKKTGMVAASFHSKDFRVALIIAKMYDKFFKHISCDDIHRDEELVKEWKDVVRKYHGKIG